MELENNSKPKSQLKSILGAHVIKEKNVTLLPKDGLMDFIHSMIYNNQELEDPFYVLDLGVVVSVMEKWKSHLPNISSFYAVKCNPNPAFLAAMAMLGSNFDCASRVEIETVLSLGVSPERIIYANPCKAESHIRYAANVGVNLTTFDSKEEIKKIKKIHPKCKLLIRIKSDDCGAKYQLGKKYGALPEEIEGLLLEAQSANLTVRGVAFHVGSIATNTCAYETAISTARSVFDVANRLGLGEMDVLDIGGGFTNSPAFVETATVIKSALLEHFKDKPALNVFAEPGRFFAEPSFTLATAVIGKRVRGELREYWINDSIYGSLNPIIQGENLYPIPVARNLNAGNPTCHHDTSTYPSKVFGQTCDSLDVVVEDYMLPELDVNDWILFANVGAYMSALHTGFNGFNTTGITTHLAYSNYEHTQDFGDQSH